MNFSSSLDEGGFSVSVLSKLPTKALSISISNVSFRFETLKAVKALFDLTDLSNVFKLISMYSRGVLRSAASLLVIALQFAPLSNNAYVGRCFPFAFTRTGTIGLIAPLPTYAAKSHSVSDDEESFSLLSSVLPLSVACLWSNEWWDILLQCSHVSSLVQFANLCPL